MPTEVTDPDLLRQLDGGTEVSDPALLSQLNGTHQYGSGQSFDVVNGQPVPTGSYQAHQALSPVAGNSFLQNTNLGIGKLYTDIALGARQAYAQTSDYLNGSQSYPALQQEAADKRSLDAPLQATVGGKVGQVVGAVPTAFVPGANTWAGAGLSGLAFGAAQPTVKGESRLLNSGIGVGTSLAGKYAGDALSNWVSQRAVQPFLGWSQKTGNAAAAQAVGSDADALTQPAIAEASQRFDQIFGAARSHNVQVPVGQATLDALDSASNSLNSSSRAALMKNGEVNDLIAHLGSNPSAAQLGSISSNLGSEAASQMTSQGGDRALGRALYSVKNHVDDLIGQSIQDPALKDAYAAAIPQYRAFSTITARPTLLNSSTGDVNLTNLGKFLQRSDKPGYLRGGNQSDLYNAARWGQANPLAATDTTIWKALGSPRKWAMAQVSQSLPGQVVGGLASRTLAPAQRLLSPGLQGLAMGSEPVALSYLTQ